MNTIERIRIKVGLTKPQMMRLLEDNPDNVILRQAQTLSLFSLSDDEVVTRAERRQPGTPSSLIQRAQEIEEAYDVWVIEIIARLESLAETSPNSILRTRDISRILGISDFHLSQLRIRGQVKASQESSRRFVYNLSDILDLVKRNSRTVSRTSRKTRGPLTNAFLSWMEETEYASEKARVLA